MPRGATREVPKVGEQKQQRPVGAGRAVGAAVVPLLWWVVVAGAAVGPLLSLFVDLGLAVARWFGLDAPGRHP